jgi:predicted RND superfamily exporter protein
MLTTSLGTGALALAITPVLGDFGLLMALSVVYSFVFTIVALPPAVLLWERYHRGWSTADLSVTA